MKTYPILRSQTGYPIKVLINIIFLAVVLMHFARSAPLVTAVAIFIPGLFLLGSSIKKVVSTESWYEWITLIFWVFLFTCLGLVYYAGLIFPMFLEGAFLLAIVLRLVFEICHVTAYMAGWVHPIGDPQYCMSLDMTESSMGYYYPKRNTNEDLDLNDLPEPGDEASVATYVDNLNHTLGLKK